MQLIVVKGYKNQIVFRVDATRRADVSPPSCAPASHRSGGLHRIKHRNGEVTWVFIGCGCHGRDPIMPRNQIYAVSMSTADTRRTMDTWGVNWRKYSELVDGRAGKESVVPDPLDADLANEPVDEEYDEEAALRDLEERTREDAASRD